MSCDSRADLMRRFTLTKTEILIKDCTINNLIKRIEILEQQRGSCSSGGAVSWFSSDKGDDVSGKRKLLLMHISSKNKELQGEEEKCNNNSNFSILREKNEEEHCSDSTKEVGSSLGREFTEATKQVTHKNEIIDDLHRYINTLETSRGYGSSFNGADDSRHDSNNGDHVGCYMVAISIDDNNVSERDSSSYDGTITTDNRDQLDPANIIGMTIKVDRSLCKKCKGCYHSRGTKQKQFLHKNKKIILESISEQALTKEDEMYSPNSQNKSRKEDNYSFWGDFLTCCIVDTTTHN
jgi:hypothetical protein